MIKSLEFKVFGLRLKAVLATLTLACLLSVPTTLFAQQQDTVQQGTVQEVTIEFQKPTVQKSANVTTMSMPQIRAQQGNGSVNNLLEMMPSVVVTSESGNGLGATYMFIRGIDQTRINTTLNGVTINNAESQGSWLVNLPDMGAYIENVSVQSGANTSDGSTSYGARVDFVTRSIHGNCSFLTALSCLRSAASLGAGTSSGFSLCALYCTFQRSSAQL